MPFWVVMAAVTFFLLLVLAYGVRYRGWPPPYPSHARRRRPGNELGADEVRQNLVAGLVWLGFILAVLWLVTALAMRVIVV